jgi:hypothetical protein
MGCMSSESSNAVDRTDKTTIPGASDAENVLRAKFNTLSDAQIQGLMNEFSRTSESGFSPFALNLQDQQQLDAARNAATNRFKTASKDFADFSAGGRGLRMSDTPISQQSFDRLGLGLADLESSFGTAGLNLGLQGNQYRTNTALGLSGAQPGAGVFNLQQYLQERMAQPTVHSTGYGTGTATQSGMQSGAALAQGVGSLGLAAAAGYSAFAI